VVLSFSVALKFASKSTLTTLLSLHERYQKVTFSYTRKIMRYPEAIQILTDWRRKGRVLFTRKELRKLFAQDGDAAFKRGLARLISLGALRRVSRGLFLFALIDSRDPHLLEQIAVALRKGCYNYLSLESALSEYGVISQVPLVGITVMTTGRSGLIKGDYIDG